MTLSLEVGRAYAFGLDDGTCPIGLVESMDEHGFTITPYDWFIGMFHLEDRWIRLDTVRMYVKAELMDPPKDPKGRWDDGCYYAEGTGPIHIMDALGTFQTDWTRRHAEAVAWSAPTFLARLLADKIIERRKFVRGDAQALGEARALGHYFSDIATMLTELPETDLVEDVLEETFILLAEVGSATTGRGSRAPRPQG